MQRVFASKQLAVDSLQDFVNYFMESCVVYRHVYGRERTEEYTIRPTYDVLDMSSENVIAFIKFVRKGW